jgi:hypothetical protein
VVPPAHRELAEELSSQQQGACGLDFPGGPGACLPEANGHAGNGHAPAGTIQITHMNGNPRLAALKARRAQERERRRTAREARP